MGSSEQIELLGHEVCKRVSDRRIDARDRIPAVSSIVMSLDRIGHLVDGYLRSGVTLRTDDRDCTLTALAGHKWASDTG